VKKKWFTYYISPAVFEFWVRYDAWRRKEGFFFGRKERSLETLIGG
jgi:hypothetical protein